MSFSESVARRGLDGALPAMIDSLTLGDGADVTALVKAIIAAESAWRPSALNPDGSTGLMQILQGPGGPFPDYSREELLDAQTNATLGILYLRDLLARYGATSDAIAAYNAGAPRRTADGQYVNQAYVDTVQTYWTWYLNHLPAVVTPSVPADEAIAGAGGGTLTATAGVGVLGAVALGVLLFRRRRA